MQSAISVNLMAYEQLVTYLGIFLSKSMHCKRHKEPNINKQKTTFETSTTTVYVRKEQKQRSNYTNLTLTQQKNTEVSKSQMSTTAKKNNLPINFAYVSIFSLLSDVS